MCVGRGVTIVIICTRVCCSVDVCSGDVQFISRLVRLVKHFMPASVLDPSQVHTVQEQLLYPLCWSVPSILFLNTFSPAVHTSILSPLKVVSFKPFSVSNYMCDSPVYRIEDYSIRTHYKV